MKVRRVVEVGLQGVGAVALLAVGALGLMGVNAVQRGFRASDPPSMAEAQAARLARSFAVPTAVRNRKCPLSATDEVLARGRAHWADHCAGCHANDGSGDTPMGRGTYPRAPDMRSGPSQAMTDGELYAVIQHGVRLTGMPAWGGGDDEAQTWELVAFIRHLPHTTAAELEEMKSMNPVSRHELEETRTEDEFLRGP